MSDEDFSRLVSNLRSAEWKFAKTYAAFMPHYYTVGAKWEDLEEFLWTAEAVTRFGITEKFFKKMPARKYFYLDGWRHWIMDPNPKDAAIINRERQEIRRPIWSE